VSRIPRGCRSPLNRRKDANLSATPSLAVTAEPGPRTSGEEFFRTEGASTGLGEPIPGGQIARWLLVEGPHIDSGVELFDELCWRLLGDNVPLWRATFHVGVLHPQIRGIGVRWLRDRKIVEQYSILHGSDETDEYRLSPIRATIEQGTPFRRRLDRPVPEFPLLERIRRAGATDYFALPLNRVFQRFPAVTWATDRPGGFADADDYYYSVASSQYAARFRVPSLILHSLDDPFIRMLAATRSALIDNPHVTYIETQRGGHCAFLAGAKNDDRRWAEATLLGFLHEHANGS